MKTTLKAATVFLLLAHLTAGVAAATNGHHKPKSAPKWQKDLHSLKQTVADIGQTVKEINVRLGGQNVTKSEEPGKVDNSTSVIISKLDEILEKADVNRKLIESLGTRPPPPPAGEQKVENVQGTSAPSSTEPTRVPAFPPAIRRIPWFAGIYAKPPSLDHFAFSCGGALIHPSFVLLARNCLVEGVSAEDYRIFLGPRFGNFENNAKARRPLAVKEILPCPKYSATTWNCNLALLRLAEPADLENPLMVATVPLSSEHAKVGETGTVVGFYNSPFDGQTSDLVIQNFTVIGPKDCMKGIGQQPPTKHFCAVAKNSAYSLKVFGSAGFVVEDGKNAVLKGMSSVGKDDPNAPYLFTDVRHYKDWIDSVLNDGQAKGDTPETQTEQGSPLPATE